MTIAAFRRRYQQVARTELSGRQAYRWVAGELRSLPYPHACAALERIFAEPARRLLGPPYGLPPRGADRQGRPRRGRGGQRTDWEGQLITMSADRARAFLSTAGASNVGRETIEQLGDDVRGLVTDYQCRPLTELLGEMADAQSRAFAFLEGRQKPEHTRELYLLAGIASGLMARASHDLGAPHDAMTQARAAFTCADNAGHSGLKVWSRGLQSVVAYWSGRLEDSVRYAERGVAEAGTTWGSSMVWLVAGQARSLAALGRVDQAALAVDQATESRERVVPR